MTNLFRPSKNEAQKTKFILSGVVISMILIGYQNCGKVNTGDKSIDGTIELKPAITDMNGTSDITLLKGLNDGLGIYSYDIDIASGKVIKRLYEVPKEDPSNVPTELCLSEEKRVALENAIENSSICFYQYPRTEDTACIQTYTYPYAVVKDTRSQSTENYKLGEHTSGCSDFYDICSEQRDNFISVVKSTLSNIESSSCE